MFCLSFALPFWNAERESFFVWLISCIVENGEGILKEWAGKGSEAH